MLNTKCFHCGRSFALDTDAAVAWLEEHKEEHPRHYPAQCHHCRRVVKIPVEQLRRYIPAKQEE